MIIDPKFRDDLLRRARSYVPSANEVGMMGRMLKAAGAKEDNGGIDIEGIATTDDIDCDDEVVLPEGIDWAPLMSYKVVYADHMYGSRYAVAKVRWINRIKSPNGWAMRARMLPGSYSEDIGRMVALAEADCLGLSIGFVPLERSSPTQDEVKKYGQARSVVRKASVFEVSFTTMPCNMACRTGAVTYDDSKYAAVERLVAKGRIPREWLPQQKKPTVVVVV